MSPNPHDNTFEPIGEEAGAIIPEGDPPAPISLAARRAEANGHAAKFARWIEFDRDSEDFVLGYEAGLLFGRLENRPASWNGTYHQANREMIRRTAEGLGYSVEMDTSEDPTWMFAEFTRK